MQKRSDSYLKRNVFLAWLQQCMQKKLASTQAKLPWMATLKPTVQENFAQHPFYQALQKPVTVDEVSVPLVAINRDTRMQGCAISQLVDAQGSTVDATHSGRFVYRTVTPQTTTGTDKIILACVHGTWSKWDAFGADETKVETPEIINFAADLARAHKKSVQIVSLKWTGNLDAKDRSEAGQTLANELKRLSKKEDKIWTISHSHGCNVVGNCAQQLGRKIDRGIFLASPALEDQKYIGGFKQLTHFYGGADFTQVAGSAEGKKNFKRKLPYPVSMPTRVHNVRVQADGADLDHINIKFPVLHNLAALLCIVDAAYPAHYDLNAHVETFTNKGPLVGLRDEKVHCPDVQVSSLAKQAEQFSRMQDAQFKGQLNKKANKTWFKAFFDVTGLSAASMALGEASSKFKNQSLVKARFKLLCQTYVDEHCEAIDQLVHSKDIKEGTIETMQVEHEALVTRLKDEFKAHQTLINKEEHESLMKQLQEKGELLHLGEVADGMSFSAGSAGDWPNT